MREKQLPKTPDFDPATFLDAQRGVWEQAIREISDGRKTGHWIWFVFPQLQALGRSTYSDIYGLDGIAEARSFYEHDILRARLEKSVRAVMINDHAKAHSIFGPLDTQKFQACLTLFDAVEPANLFNEALDTCFGGVRHQQTLNLLRTASDKGLFKRLLSWQRSTGAEHRSDRVKLREVYERSTSFLRKV